MLTTAILNILTERNVSIVHGAKQLKSALFTNSNVTRVVLVALLMALDIAAVRVLILNGTTTA